MRDIQHCRKRERVAMPMKHGLPIERTERAASSLARQAERGPTDLLCRPERTRAPKARAINCAPGRSPKSAFLLDAAMDDAQFVNEKRIFVAFVGADGPPRMTTMSGESRSTRNTSTPHRSTEFDSRPLKIRPRTRPNLRNAHGKWRERISCRLCLGVELQRSRVDAVALAGRLRIIENVDQDAHRIWNRASTHRMPWLVSSCDATRLSLEGCVKLGQPQPASNC